MRDENKQSANYTLTFNLRGIYYCSVKTESGKQEKTYAPGQDDLKASDVLKLAGLTYRQLHDWEQRAGILQIQRANTESWRKFTFEEVVALTICARLRERFALPLEKTGEIYAWLLGKKTNWGQDLAAKLAADYLKSIKKDPKLSAIVSGQVEGLGKKLEKDEELQHVVMRYINAVIKINTVRPVLHAFKMAQLGIPAYLMIGQGEAIIFDEDSLVRWIVQRFDEPIIVFPLTKIISEICAIAKIPQFKLDQFFSSFQDYWNELRLDKEVTPSEREVLHLIRERDYQSVTVHIDGGEIVRLEREESLSTNERTRLEKEIIKIVGEGTHQSVRLETFEGKIVRISRKQSVKLNKGTGRT